MRLIAVDLLDDAGLISVEAENAAQAMLQLERHGSIGVVWTDIQMPGRVDGLGFALEARERWPQLELVFVSGGTILTDKELPERSVFFAKPYIGTTVVEVIRRFHH
jgi:DNA-binding NtrC family response regulator